jgi:hypothetical protein
VFAAASALFSGEEDRASGVRQRSTDVHEPRIDNLCQPGNPDLAGTAENLNSGNKKQKSSELAFAAPWLVPSPEYFAKIKSTT